MKHTNYTIATIGSHSALTILHGAKQEGFKTLVVAPLKRARFYRRFEFIDEVIEIKDYSQFDGVAKKLEKRKVVLVPHGSFVAYLGVEGNKKIQLPYFGSKDVLDWEGNRVMQLKWMVEAGVRVPKSFSGDDVIDRSVIVKTFGASGGSGYFVVHNQKEFDQKIGRLGDKEYVVQEYVIGVPMYFQFFYSPLTDQVELLAVDRRYESNVDALGRMPLSHQEMIDIQPSFVVVGNSPLMVRESLMPDLYEMAERVVKTSKKLIGGKGLYGPFCLETIVTDQQEIVLIEISCRIVAGANMFVSGSPYAFYHFNEPMSLGRRICREVKLGVKQGRLDEMLD